MLSSVLIINEDRKTSLDIKSKLPEKLKVNLRKNLDNCDYDAIVVINNGEKDRISAKSQYKKIMSKTSTDTQIFLAGFEPRWIDCIHPNTKLIETNQVIPYLKIEHYHQSNQRVHKITSPQTTLILSYNEITGYDEGVYGEGKLIVLAIEKHESKDDEFYGILKLEKKLADIYGKFSWQTDMGKFKNIFIYDGDSDRHGKPISSYLAKCLNNIMCKVRVLTCGCDYNRKFNEYRNSDPLTRYNTIECYGSDSLGMIADIVLGVSRPNTDHSKMSFLKKIVSAEAKEYIPE